MIMKQSVARVFAIILVFSLVLTLVQADEAAVADFAGTGEMGFKDGDAMKATFTLPYSLTLDKDGGILVVDSHSNRIRRIKDGVVVTIAGFTDSLDYFGLPEGGYKDGAAAEARFDNPRSAVLDSKGSIYVSDTNNHVIRKIANGIVYTFSGTGKAGYKNGKSSETQFNYPTGLAIDSKDNIYVADTMNNVIRKIAPDGSTTTFAGVRLTTGKLRNGKSSAAYFNEPCDLAIGKDGAIYVLDGGNQVIRKIANDMVTTYAGSGTEKLEDTNYIKGGYADGIKRLAQFNFPKGMYIAEDNTIILADTYNHRIRAIKPDGQVVTLAGSGTAGKENKAPLEAMFSAPSDVLYHEGNLYISDMWNNSIRVMPYSMEEIEIYDPLTGIIFDKADTVQIWLDKARVAFDEVQPFINEEGKTLVELEQMLKAIGAELTVLDEASHSAEFKLGGTAYILELDKYAAKTQNGRTFVHIRAITDALGYNVYWVSEHQAVVISTVKNADK